jgi:hypothetical protein
VGASTELDVALELPNSFQSYEAAREHFKWRRWIHQFRANPQVEHRGKNHFRLYRVLKFHHAAEISNLKSVFALLT